MLNILQQQQQTDLDDYDSVEQSETKPSYFELSPENQRHLERLEQEFLNDIDTANFLKSCISTVMFNSFNIALSLYCINIGLGLWMSAIAGFSVGAIPGLKTLSDSLNIQVEKTDNWNFTGINVNGKLLKGVLLTFLSATLTFNSVSEWRIVQDLSRKSYIEFQKDTARFENPQQVALDNNLVYLLYAGGGITLLGFISYLRRSGDRVPF